ncbi:MAG: universal stress protein [Desulfovibrionaceae bacterium]
MKTIQKILCAIDLSEVSGQIADYAALQAHMMHAEVHVLYVAPALNQYSDAEMPLAIIKNFIAERIENAEKVMPDFMKTHFAQVNATSKIISGYPPDAILDTARDENFDMIVIGTHGRRGVNAAVFGSVAEKVVKQSRVPVLVIRPQ